MNSLAARIKKPYLVIQIIAALAIIAGGIIAAVNVFNIYSKVQGGLRFFFRNLVNVDYYLTCYTCGTTLLIVGAIVSFCIAVAMKLIAQKSSITPIAVNGFGISIANLFLVSVIIPFSSFNNFAQHIYETIEFEKEDWLYTIKNEIVFAVVWVIVMMLLSAILIIISIVNLAKKERVNTVENQ